VARIVAQVRARWPCVHILLRAASGFGREVLMAWGEANRVDYLFGLARNARLEAEVAGERTKAVAESQATGHPARRFHDFMWTTLARSIAGAGSAGSSTGPNAHGDPNPALVVTSPKPNAAEPRYLDISTRGSIARAARWRTASSSSPTGRPPRPCAPTNCACGSLRGPMFSSVAPHRPRPHPIRRHLRHHPSGASQDQRPGADQRLARSPRDGIGMSVAITGAT